MYFFSLVCTHHPSVFIARCCVAWRRRAIFPRVCLTYQYFAEMRKQGVDPDTATYNSFLKLIQRIKDDDDYDFYDVRSFFSPPSPFSPLASFSLFFYGFFLIHLLLPSLYSHPLRV